MDKPKLHLDWATYKAAKYAVMHWHYSQRMPDSKNVKIGVWEDDRYVGVVIFSRGISGTNVAKSFGLKLTEIAELSRVALSDHRTPTSRIIRIAINLLRSANPGLRLLLSYADENQGHLGIIYQAGNWLYTGLSARVAIYRAKDGALLHNRSCSSTGSKRQYGVIKPCPNRNDLERIEQKPKWRYMMPLDSEVRDSVLLRQKPYPKRVGSIDSDVTGIQPDQGGASPTSTLQKKRKTKRG